MPSCFSGSSDPSIPRAVDTSEGGYTIYIVTGSGPGGGSDTWARHDDMARSVMRHGLGGGLEIRVETKAEFHAFAQQLLKRGDNSKRPGLRQGPGPKDLVVYLTDPASENTNDRTPGHEVMDTLIRFSHAGVRIFPPANNMRFLKLKPEYMEVIRKLHTSAGQQCPFLPYVVFPADVACPDLRTFTAAVDAVMGDSKPGGAVLKGSPGARSEFVHIFTKSVTGGEFPYSKMYALLKKYLQLDAQIAHVIVQRYSEPLAADWSCSNDKITGEVCVYQRFVIKVDGTTGMIPHVVLGHSPKDPASSCVDVTVCQVVKVDGSIEDEVEMKNKSLQRVVDLGNSVAEKYVDTAGFTPCIRIDLSDDNGVATVNEITIINSAFLYLDENEPATAELKQSLLHFIAYMTGRVDKIAQGDRYPAT